MSSPIPRSATVSISPDRQRDDGAADSGGESADITPAKKVPVLTVRKPPAKQPSTDTPSSTGSKKSTVRFACVYFYMLLLYPPCAPCQMPCVGGMKNPCEHKGGATKFTYLLAAYTVADLACRTRAQEHLLLRRRRKNWPC